MSSAYWIRSIWRWFHISTFSVWTHTPTRESEAIQMNVPQNVWLVSEQNFSVPYTYSYPRNSGLWAWKTGHHAITRSKLFHRCICEFIYSSRASISFTSPSCEMGYNRKVLKLISITQITMSAIFLALGMADRYEARFIYTSYLFTPCWIAALISTLRCKVRAVVPRSVLSYAKLRRR